MLWFNNLLQIGLLFLAKHYAYHKTSGAHFKQFLPWFFRKTLNIENFYTRFYLTKNTRIWIKLMSILKTFVLSRVKFILLFGSFFRKVHFWYIFIQKFLE